MTISFNQNAKISLGKSVNISVGFSQSGSLPPLPAGSFYFTLGSNSTTSAGVYDVTGSLVRTIWNNVSYPSGLNTGSWDGKDNSGTTYSNPVEIRVLSSNIQYQWDATIGNSSTPPTGSTKIRALRSVWDYEEIGNYIYYCTGFVEGNSTLHKWLKSDLTYMTDVRPTVNGDITGETKNLSYDNSTGILYCDGVDPYKNAGSNIDAFIYAITASNDSDYNFPSGSTITMSYADQTYRAIGVVTSDPTAIITGLAVMNSGSYLYSTHKGQNKTKIYNKTSGELLSSSSLSLSDIAIEGTHLYGISGSLVVKYNINTGTGNLTATNVSMSFTAPLRVSVKNDILLVADGGSSQQIKAYTTSGSALWTHGQASGYTNSPYAANDKFQFYDFNDDSAKTGLMQQSDNSIWIADSGNCRSIYINSSRTYLNTVSYLPMNYSAAVNMNNPARVFACFLEFDASTGELVANWKANLYSHSPQTDYLTGNNQFNIFRYVWDKGGKTYATVTNYSSVNTDGLFAEMVELTSTGIRLTGVNFDYWSDNAVNEDGDIINLPYNEASAGTITLTKQLSTGINGSNNPTWGTSQTITSIPLGADKPSLYNDRGHSKGYIFSPNWVNGGYHLGRVVSGSWKWLTSPSTAQSYTGDFPTDGTFDCGNGIPGFGGYAGGRSYSVDSLVVYNYVGEGWKNNQVNIWNLFHEDGLMLYQIGKTGPQSEASSSTVDAPIEAAGNAYGAGFVKSGSAYYIYHCDESRHGAIHRFKITGVDTVSIQTPTLY